MTGAARVVTIHDLAFHLYPEQYPGAKQRYLRLMTRLSVQRAARATGAAVVAYGKFVNNVLTFIIVALAVFFLLVTGNTVPAPRGRARGSGSRDRPCRRPHCCAARSV